MHALSENDVILSIHHALYGHFNSIELEINYIYSIINFYEDGSPVRDINGIILEPISYDQIKSAIIQNGRD